MTQGERIKRIRMFRKITQKELGIGCGYPENSADVRIRQYESNLNTPRKDTLLILAKALSVNYRAIQNYDMGCAEDILETLFWLEESSSIDLIEFTRTVQKDNDWVFDARYNDFNYMPSRSPIGIIIKHNLVNNFMKEWLIRFNEYKNNQISYDEYFEWKINWPLSCDEKKDKSDYVDWHKNN